MAKMAYTPSAAAKVASAGKSAPAVKSGAAVKAAAPAPEQEMSAEEKSKDAFFVQLAQITDAMIAKHGKDFAMGTLILSARFVAENKPLVKKH